MSGEHNAATMLASGIDARILPKVLLHDHLDGGLRPETILELAPAAGIELPAADAAGLAEWFRAAADSGSLETYLETFAITVGVMQTADNLQRVAHEAVVDLAADGVIYAELRWAPEQHLAGGLDLEAAVDAVETGLVEGVAAAVAAGHRIQVRQLLCAMRHTDQAETIAMLAVRRRDAASLTACGAEGAVCGFDIAGPEAGFPPASHRAAFDCCARQWLPVTCHAGEAAGLDSIESALLDARTLRLGHGTRLADDLTRDADGNTVLGAVSTWVRDRRIAIESCPSSNVQTAAADSIATHPIDSFIRLGFAVTVNTDNRLMSDTSASKELALVANTFGYDLDDLELLQLNAADAAFVPLAERDALVEAISSGFDEVRK